MKKKIGFIVLVFILLFVSIFAFNTFATDESNDCLLYTSRCV